MTSLERALLDGDGICMTKIAWLRWLRSGRIVSSCKRQPLDEAIEQFRATTVSCQANPFSAHLRPSSSHEHWPHAGPMIA